MTGRAGGDFLQAKCRAGVPSPPAGCPTTLRAGLRTARRGADTTAAGPRRQAASRGEGRMAAPRRGLPRNLRSRSGKGHVHSVWAPVQHLRRLVGEPRGGIDLRPAPYQGAVNGRPTPRPSPPPARPQRRGSRARSTAASPSGPADASHGGACTESGPRCIRAGGRAQSHHRSRS